MMIFSGLCHVVLECRLQQILRNQVFVVLGEISQGLQRRESVMIKWQRLF